MLMATAQAFLSAELRRLEPAQDPAVAVTALNRYLCERPLGGRFMSLWVGVLMPDGALTFVDAGHGHWAAVRMGGEVSGPGAALESGGIPLGSTRTPGTQRRTLTLGAGDRVLVYSDGIVEQRGKGGSSSGARVSTMRSVAKPRHSRTSSGSSGRCPCTARG